MLTRPYVALDATSDLQVSVAKDARAKLAAAAVAEPDDEPNVGIVRWYGLMVCPRRLLRPSGTENDRYLVVSRCFGCYPARSDMFALPKMMAPALRRSRMTAASLRGRASSRATEPAVVFMRSAVATLSLPGMPHSGNFAKSALPRLAAICSASGFVSRMALRWG